MRDNATKYSNSSTIIILLVVLSLTQDNFLGTSSPKNLPRDTTPLMTMSAGMTIVLLLGSIDLSMGVVCSISDVTHVHLRLALQNSFSNPLLTSLAVMMVSLTFGLVSNLVLGIIRVKLRVPFFIVFLDFMSLWQSAALLITQNPELVPKTLRGAVEWHKIAFSVVDLLLIMAIAIILSVHYITYYASSGRTVFAIGGDERAARMADMGMDKTEVLVFAINGVSTTLASILLATSFHSSASIIGDPFTLKIVAACALSDTSLADGKGSELGTILDVFTVAIIGNGMSLIGISAYYQNVVSGIFVLAAITLTAGRSICGWIVK